MKKTITQNIHWGIGIEHEMRVRFQKKYIQLSQELSSSFFPSEMTQTLQESSGYLFVNSMVLLFYFKFMKPFLCKTFFQYAKTEKEKEFANEMTIFYDLYKKAKSKTMYPLDNPLYFIRSEDPIQIQKNKRYVEFYIKMYSLYHYPLLFFEIHYRENENLSIRLQNFWNLSYQMENIMSQDSFDEFLSHFTLFYEGDTYEMMKAQLTELLETNSHIRDLVMDVLPSDHDFKMCLYLSDIYMEDDMKRIEIEDIEKLEERYIFVFKNMMEKNYDFEGEIDLSDEEFYTRLYEIYSDHVIPDYSFRTSAIEFTTMHYKNISFESAHQELMTYEQVFFTVMNQIPIYEKYVRIFGPLGYHHTGSVGKTLEIYDIVTFDYVIIDEDYTGSYHIWITPPYRPNTTPERFMEECATLANKFQLIEPLIAAHFTSPSVEALGDDQQLARSSFRQFVGAFSNYGTSDVSFLMGAPTHSISKYYMSMEDLKKMLEDGNDMAIFAYVETPVYNMYGKQILNLEKLEERLMTSNVYRSFRQGDKNSTPPKNVEDYYSLVFQKSKIRPVDNYLQIGPDIRTKNYPIMKYPLSEGWTREYVKKNQKYIEVYVNPSLKKISYTPVYDEKIYKMLLSEERIGIEMRVFDHFPTIHMKQILSILACLTYQSYEKPYRVTNENMYIHKQWWHDEMAKVILEGFEYRPSREYIRNIGKEFQLGEIKMSKFERTMVRRTGTEVILGMILRRMNLKYQKYNLYDRLQFKNRNIMFVNMNEISWNSNFRDFLEKNPEYAEKMKRRMMKSNIIKILGKRYTKNVNRIQRFLLKK